MILKTQPSTERTGAAIFRKELDFSRNRLLEHMSNKEKEIDPRALLDTYFDKGYALPVNRDVDFIRFLEDVSKEEGIIGQDNPEILKSFEEILGGEYKATKDALYFVPQKSGVKLKMGESASSVRSLLSLAVCRIQASHRILKRSILSVLICINQCFGRSDVI